jgi:hypothetical protein
MGMQLPPFLQQVGKYAEEVYAPLNLAVSTLTIERAAAAIC